MKCLILHSASQDGQYYLVGYLGIGVTDDLCFKDIDLSGNSFQRYTNQLPYGTSNSPYFEDYIMVIVYKIVMISTFEL